MTFLKNLDLRAVIALFVLWLIFFWRILTPIAADQASFKQGDFSGQFVAFGAYQYERLSQGEIPLWNPYNNGGLPFIADTQAAVFYPPRWLTIALASLTGGWSYHVLELEAIAHVLLYSLLMYAFARRLTGSVWAGVTSAIIAAYGGFIAGYPPLQLALLEAAIWLPLAALAILEATRAEDIQWRCLIGAGFALGLSWLAGHPQTSWFLTYFLIAWLAYRLYEQGRSWRDSLLGTVLMGVTTFGTTAVTFLPGLEYLRLTVRSDLGFAVKGNGFPFQDIAQLILPGTVSSFSPLYVGIPALILIAIAIAYRWRASRFWVLVALSAWLLSLGANSMLYHVLYNFVPGLRFFRGQERAAFLVANSFAVLAGWGMMHLVNWSHTHNDERLRRIINISMSLVGVLASLIFVGWLGQVGEGFGQIVSSATLSALIMLGVWALLQHLLRHEHSTDWIMLALLALIVFELFSVNMDADTNYDSIPPDQQLVMSPPPLVQSVQNIEDTMPYRVDGFRGLQANYGSLYQVMDIRGISPLFLDSVWRIVYRDYVNNPRAWDVFAVRYIFSEREQFTQPSTQIITTGADRDGPVFLHEITEPRAFAHLVYAVAVVGSDEHAVELLFDPNFPVRDTVILQQNPSLALPDDPTPIGTAQITEFAPEAITIRIDTPHNAILTLAQVDYPGWQATLNGVSVEILRAYGSLSAFEIPAGQHTLQMTYHPLSYRIGLIISVITWGIIIVLGVYTLIRVARRQSTEESA
ncbi:MAG: YfhO family protein [Anaerolineae bacterium]